MMPVAKYWDGSTWKPFTGVPGPQGPAGSSLLVHPGNSAMVGNFISFVSVGVSWQVIWSANFVPTVTGIYLFHHAFTIYTPGNSAGYYLSKINGTQVTGTTRYHSQGNATWQGCGLSNTLWCQSGTTYNVDLEGIADAGGMAPNFWNASCHASLIASTP
jgi:hypothetical protein